MLISLLRSLAIGNRDSLTATTEQFYVNCYASFSFYVKSNNTGEIFMNMFQFAQIPLSYGSLNPRYLTRINDTVMGALANHPRVLIARIDLRILNNGGYSDNPLERDVPTSFVNIGVGLIKRFIASLNAQIATDQMNKANVSFLFEIYEAARRVKPNDNDVSKWMNVITQGGSREGVYRALVLDNTYAAMENYDTPMTDTGIEFAKYYVLEFMNKEISKDSLEKTNFYTLKRVLVEQTLEILDELLFKDVNLFYDWYAVFSAESAKKYPNFFTNKIRKSVSRERHRKWAQYVPTQHVKSEVIIKLHKLFNATNQ